jgi:hypothetical protein
MIYMPVKASLPQAQNGWISRKPLFIVAVWMDLALEEAEERRSAQAEEGANARPERRRGTDHRRTVP